MGWCILTNCNYYHCSVSRESCYTLLISVLDRVVSVSTYSGVRSGNVRDLVSLLNQDQE